MLKRVVAGLFVGLMILTLTVAVWADAPAPTDPHKQTSVGKYVTAAEAYEKWSADQGKIKVLDVRTPEEYVFVGHAPMARNIPLRLWTGKWVADKKGFDLAENGRFVDAVKKFAATDEALFVMCRSGQRSAAAVNLLAKAGFTNVYNIVDGFEGDMVTSEDSPNKGKRMLNGWKNSSAPWTYALDPALVYNQEN